MFNSELQGPGHISLDDADELLAKKLQAGCLYCTYTIVLPVTDTYKTQEDAIDGWLCLCTRWPKSYFACLKQCTGMHYVGPHQQLCMRGTSSSDSQPALIDKFTECLLHDILQPSKIMTLLL